MELDKLRAPLLLVDAAGGKVYGRTRIQKMMFLAQQEEGLDENPFEFFPWDYGPYSKELQQYLDVLVDLHLLQEATEQGKDGHKAYRYEITPQGQAFLRGQDGGQLQAQRATLRRLADIWTRSSLEDLIRHVYGNHPSYAVRSKLGLGGG